MNLLSINDEVLTSKQEQKNLLNSSNIRGLK